MLSENLTVKKIIDKQVELKYDNDYFGASLSAGAGHIIDFSPPATPFTVKQIKVFGRLSAKVPGYENNPFDLQILDKNLKVIYTSTYTYNKFSFNPAVWVSFDVPDVQVNNRFYVLVYTKSTSGAMGIGADNTTINEHSDVAIRDAWAISRS